MAKKDIGAEGSTPSPTLPLPGGGSDSLRVAYHNGPEEIGFFGREWQRGIAQSVTANELAGMQARGDYNEFNFKQE